MKKTSIIVILLFTSTFALTQSTQKTKISFEPVRVTNWGDRGLVLLDGFFKETQDSIIAQIGAEEFEKVKQYCSYSGWPGAMHDSIWTKKDSIVKKEFYKKLDKLKIYKIANYQHYWEGSKKSRRCIISVPYNDNKDWDKSAKWDTVYFIIRERSVEKKQKGIFEPVRITNWGSRGRYFLDGFFNETQDSIIAQIGVEEFEKVKQYSSVYSWPEALQGQIWTRKDSIVKKEFYKKLDKLKIYRIADYQHYWEGSKRARRCIISVPYSDNKDWDKSAK